VRLVNLVTPAVRLEIGELGEGLGTTLMSALVWFVSCVSSDVLLKMRELSELSLTNLTSVGFDAKVDSHVLGEVGAVGEGLAAVTALVWFRLPHVNLSVKLQVGFGTESLRTHLALILS